MLSGKQQVFVAPGDEDALLTETDLPWLSGHILSVPLEHWDVLLAEAKLMNGRMGAELERASGVFEPGADHHIRMEHEALARLAAFVEQLAEALRSRRHLNAPLPEDLEYALPTADYAEMASIFGNVLREALRLDRPFEAWTEWY